MRFSRTSAKLTGSIHTSMHAVVAAGLSALLAGQPMYAAPVPKRGPTAGTPPVIKQMVGDERVLHALNRLTFGPRPGDVAAVKAMGLDKWFEMQLNPAQIDDSALDAKLAMFPAMQLSQAELERRFPGPQTLKRLAETNAPLPADPTQHAIYAVGVQQYKMRTAAAEAAKAAAPADPAMGGMAGDNAMGGTAPDGSMATAAPAKKGKKAAQAATMSSTPGGDMAGGDMMAPGTPRPAADAPPDMAGNPNGPPPAEHLEALYKDLDAVKILNLPPDQRMAKILAMQPKEMQSFRQSLDGPELAQLAEGLTPQQRETLTALQRPGQVVGGELLQSRLMRDIYSDRQLQAVMTDFWLNHFNVYIRKNQNEQYLIPEFAREAILPNALGKFEDLLVATAKSPAMLVYLDNQQSVGPDSPAAKQGPRLAAYAQNPQVQAALKGRGLNENYGRELMELHTLGVNGGYTQADVTMVAKVFTGWTVAQPGQPGPAGRFAPAIAGRRGGGFYFDERRHEPGAKTVLGKTIQENGENEGLEVLHMLATSPATAKFISTKLAVRFVADDPAPALVDRMTKTFLSSDGDIKAVLRTMFNSPEFWAKSVERTKVKTPEEFVISAVRASGATVNNAQPLVAALDRLGMPLYGMQTPNGYSWMSEPWVSTGALVTRMNFALVLSGDRLGGTRMDWTKLLGDIHVTAKPVSLTTGGPAVDVDPETAAKEKKLEMILLGEPVSSRTRATVLAQSNDTTAAIEAAKEFQGRPAGGAKGAKALAGGNYDPLLPFARANGARAAQGPPPNDDRQAAVMAGLLLGSPEFQRR